MGPVASGSLLRVDPPRHAPQRRALFRRRASPHLRPTSRRPKCPSLALRFDACAIPPSRIFGCLAEEQRRLALSSLVLGLGSSARAVWSSRSFGDRTEGGVPNSSPSEPRFDLQEGRGFDLVGAFGAPKRHPSGWAPQRWSAKRSPCRPAQMLHASAEETKFSELVR